MKTMKNLIFSMCFSLTIIFAYLYAKETNKHVINPHEYQIEMLPDSLIIYDDTRIVYKSCYWETNLDSALFEDNY